ncbi:helicase-related protein, partial [Candidatus Omnitrophota bacterium]
SFNKKDFYYHRGRRFPKKEHLKPNRSDSLIRHLFERNKLPCIYFCFGRRRCEYLAEEMRGFDFLNAEEKVKIRGLFNELCERFDLVGDKKASSIFPLIERGIAFHHAGMLPTLKEVIERLFTSRLIKVIFTTETFALGINMPARTVIFDELRKYYGRFHRNLKTRDFYQMAGRAGRRGIDEEGFVYSRINSRYLSLPELKEIIYGNPERVRSRFNASYATVLNLYEKHGEKIYDIYPRSFHAFQEKKKRQEKALAALHAKVQILKEFGCIEKNKLTGKGLFAAKIYGYELSLSELYAENVLEYLSAKELGILCLALVYEPRRGVARPPVKKHIKGMQNRTDEIVSQIQKRETKLGIVPLSKAYSYGLSTALEAWMKGEEFDKMLQLTECDEGEIIRYYRMAMQILREILDTPVSPQLKENAKKAIYLINRGVIDAEKQLRG